MSEENCSRGAKEGIKQCKTRTAQPDKNPPRSAGRTAEFELAVGLHDIIAADTLYRLTDVNLRFGGGVSVIKKCSALSLSTDLGVT